MNNFEHRVLRIEPIITAVQRCASRSTVLNLHRDKNRRREPGRDVKILSDRMLHIEGSSAQHSRCTCLDRHSRSADEQLHNNRAAQKMPSKKDDCLRQPVWFIYSQAWHFPVQY